MQPGWAEIPGSWRGEGEGGRGLEPHGESPVALSAPLMGGLMETQRGACLRSHNSQWQK